jgi:hypothetical protein
VANETVIAAIQAVRQDTLDLLNRLD